ncbi:BREX-2 system adenine-specific DNA-methyltransferase PglX [Nocardioides sp. Y6]|uniref:site-specific DNA-methyltransferase (adenine-specific) n=1 Tax=Nocardioides malaquae TaxID=2773426 RepID=A0ABR9RU96_9ACTN|nr:BREX-2 system adenine-specific DNA-methyltransferase PglX [Nocardioides malaquae]MBE7325177.1 BREX-2 system adenine-specific DNA-methyltransferase PglX [Nocardioides malaquae]
MIHSAALLADLKAQLKLLQADLRERADDTADTWGARLREQHRTALERGRTGHAWVTWRDNEVDQAAVAWIVATTFIRFCEDNGLLAGARDAAGRPVAMPWIAGPGVLLTRALEHETAFFTADPSANRRDWLQQAFTVLASQPAGHELVDRDHSPVWSALISAEAADRLVTFWRTTDTDGDLVHDFTDPDLGTRFLGDLYQELSEHAKKTYALLQTPDFVEEFILALTLTPAVEEFGLTGLKLIDPTCGSGHFLLGAFARLNDLWAQEAPALDVRERVQRAMGSIHGVDLNPFAVAIARFRLTVAGLKAVGARSLVEAPDFAYRLAVGDALLGTHEAQLEISLGLDEDDEIYEYDTEDLSDYHGILKPGQYHVVVGNPPYITVKDKVLNQTYREQYKMCSGTYALSVPFMELFFQLLLKGEAGQTAGYTGQITANSFMKREFGKKVTETLLAGHDLGNPVDLTHVIDTSGAYIPGHGTPTVILVGRRRRPQTETVRAILGVRGEPGQPSDPNSGLVWREIVEHVDSPGTEGMHVSVVDLARNDLRSHPWSLSGGASSLVTSRVEAGAAKRLGALLEVGIGGAIRAGSDEVYMRPRALPREKSAFDYVRPFVVGDGIRDYVDAGKQRIVFPYEPDLSPTTRLDETLWQWRTFLAARSTFQGVMADAGLRWSEYMQFTRWSVRAARAITFAFVATHNHFVLDRGGKVFNRSAPVIKLPESATEQDHLDLLGVLNSSTACFWLKQVSHNKGSTVDTKGARQTQVPWEDFYEFTGTKLKEFPLPAALPGATGRRLDELATALTTTSPRSLLSDPSAPDLAAAVARGRAEWAGTRARMIFEQEELDWEVYRLYGLVDDDLTYTGAWPEDERQLALGERAFEIALARKVADGSEETAWFDRHGSTPRTDLPDPWPADYRDLVQRRLDLIASDKAIGLLERPEFKRRWATPGWDALLREALRDAMLDRLEQRELWFDATGAPLPRSIAELADAVRHDAFLSQCALLLAGSDVVDLTAVLGDLLKDEPVPHLAALRYKEPGIEKYRTWQEVWELQRREDAGEQVTIPVPPKYKPTDFRKTSFWQARGKLDVPKERFIAYPGVQRTGDSTPVIGWAGWDHAEQAQALAREFGQQQALGADSEQLIPLLAGLAELQPWLDQWHSEIDPRFGQSPAAVIRSMSDSWAQQVGVTRADLDAWRPPAPTRGRRRTT